MESNETAVEVLKQIRDETRKTNERLESVELSVGERLESMERSVGERFESVEHRLERMEHRQAESEIRISTELVAVATAVDRVRDLLAARNELGDKVVDHEKRISDIERRLGS